MNDFENEDALDDFEVEITDLDSDHEKSRASVLWLYGQRLWPQARLWMNLLTVVGVTILIVTLSSPLLLQFSHGTEKAPGIPARHSSQQETNCGPSSGSIIVVSSTGNGAFWYKGKGVPDEVQVEVVAASCIQFINVQMVPGSNGTISGDRKK